MWVMAEVYEQDLAFVKVGDTARVTVNAWPDGAFDGRVTFIYPALGKESRTARLRIEVANPDGRLRAEMAAHRRDCHAARRQPARRAGVGGDRQRPAPGRARRTRRGPIRTTAGQARRPRAGLGADP
jgi:hypothetical protein